MSEHQTIADGFVRPAHRWGRWKSPGNRRAYMQWLRKKLGFSQSGDWYAIQYDDFQRNAGDGFLRCYRYSPMRAVIKEIDPPPGGWIPWYFAKLPNGYWRKKANRKSYIDWLGGKLGIRKTRDWYRVSKEDFTANHGGAFLNSYDNKPSAAIAELIPNPSGWLPWLFGKTPARAWSSPGIQKDYMRWLGKRLGYRRPEDWYGVSAASFEKNEGRGLLEEFGRSPVKAVMSLVKNPGRWLVWKFRNVPLDYWNDKAHRRDYVQWLKKELGLRALSGWHGVTAQRVARHGGNTLLYHNYNGSVEAMVRDLVPNKRGWKREDFSLKSKKQRTLFRVVQALFPNDRCLFNHHHPELRFKKTRLRKARTPMELDIFLPDRSIAFEYQGEQHAQRDRRQTEEEFRRQRSRDRQKAAACKRHRPRIYLLAVPHTWQEGDAHEIVRRLRRLVPRRLLGGMRSAATTSRPRRVLSRLRSGASRAW